MSSSGSSSFPFSTTSSSSSSSEDSSCSLSSSSCSPISLDVIKNATNDFDDKKVIGRGGEATVYLAEIYLYSKTETTRVAVKHLSENSSEFEKEILTVTKFKHPNLVSLLGYCKESNKRILIYEYMGNGSLANYVKKDSPICLSWKQRLKICLGAAYGLQHLHKPTNEYRKGIIHRDVKPANILLDENWVAKVSDFGMFKVSNSSQNNSTIITGAIKGTHGYFAPEAMSYHVSTKVDVYAFGVVMFEVLCLKQPWDRGDVSFYVEQNNDIGRWARENVDIKIKADISNESLKAFTNAIGKSLRFKSNKRPTMDGVVLLLESALKCQEHEDERILNIGLKAPSDAFPILPFTSKRSQGTELAPPPPPPPPPAPPAPPSPPPRVLQLKYLANKQALNPLPPPLSPQPRLASPQAPKPPLPPMPSSSGREIAPKKLSRFWFESKKGTPDGLLELVDRLYVFKSCFSTEAVPEESHRLQLHEIIKELHAKSPESSSFLALNFREGERKTQFTDILSECDVTVMDYPRQYEGCPLLPLHLIHHLLRLCENWLMLGNSQVILFHCEIGGWPTLAFLLSSFLVFTKLHSEERKSLDTVYRDAPKGLLRLLSPLNPFPSQLRYLQYIKQRNSSQDWPPPERALSFDCLILRAIPLFDDQNGCRPVIRIFGSLLSADKHSTQMLFSTRNNGKSIRNYSQEDSGFIKIDIQCLVKGDVVLECVHWDHEVEREVMMFRVMFNTAFIKSNMMMLDCEDMDIVWDSKGRYPKTFRAEFLFEDIENISHMQDPVSVVEEALDDEECFEVEEPFYYNI